MKTLKVLAIATMLTGSFLLGRATDSCGREKKAMMQRYEMVYGFPQSKEMQSVERYIFSGLGRHQALTVDIIEELNIDHKHID